MGVHCTEFLWGLYKAVSIKTHNPGAGTYPIPAKMTHFTKSGGS